MSSLLITLAHATESPDRSVIATDERGVVVYWGRGAESLYGWSEHEALGRDVVDVTPGELSRQEAQAIMSELMAGSPWSGEFVVRDRNGNRFTAHVTDIPIYDPVGRLTGILGVSRRISYLER